MRAKSGLAGCCILACSFLWLNTACAQVSTDTLMLGDRQVLLVAHTSGKPGFFYYNMHDNESTSVKAAKKIVLKRGGVLFELVHSGKRNIEFTHGDSIIAIDPNRIYTEKGIWRELTRNNCTDTAAFDLVLNFSAQLITRMKIDSQDLVVALHNNTNHNYSYLSYTPGGDYEAEAASTHKGRKRDEDAFYFVTSPVIFEDLKKTKFNIVLQDNANATDDGSLSVYCGQRGIDYINVEAQHNRKCRNRKMIRQMLD